MTLPRVVSAETLDVLPEADPAAVRSRRDLKRVHRAMGTRLIVARALRDDGIARDAAAPLRVLELGAGDGTLLLGVAALLARRWPRVELTLLDRQRLVDRATISRYAELGWTASVEVVDVLDWAADVTRAAAARPRSRDTADGSDAASRRSTDTRAALHWDLIVANLFVHHFESAQLGALLAAVASCTDRFFACEPRRGWFALGASHLVGAIGANAVTRNDAVLSVHAGFRDAELSALWPVSAGRWRLAEYRAGLFSHCFDAVRRGEATRSVAAGASA